MNRDGLWQRTPASSRSPKNRPPGRASRKPVHEGGLGFGFKWNMGFMHDTLHYMARDPVHRAHHHDDITFGLIYAFSREFRPAAQP